MNNTKKYAKLLSSYLQAFSERYGKSANGLRIMTLIDTERHHYQAITHGFQKEPKKRVFSILFHFDIIDGKIWFQCNHTDLLIEEELLKLGIPKSDIVFGWLPEYARAHSGWGIDKAA